MKIKLCLVSQQYRNEYDDVGEKTSVVGAKLCVGEAELRRFTLLPNREHLQPSSRQPSSRGPPAAQIRLVDEQLYQQGLLDGELVLPLLLLPREWHQPAAFLTDYSTALSPAFEAE